MSPTMLQYLKCADTLVTQLGMMELTTGGLQCGDSTRRAGVIFKVPNCPKVYLVLDSFRRRILKASSGL